MTAGAGTRGGATVPAADGDAGDGEVTGPVRLWHCTGGALSARHASVLAMRWLDADERRTAARFHLDADRRQFVVAHLLVRRVLAQETGVPEAAATLRRTPYGRPYLDASRPAGPGCLDFNLSHTRGHNLLGVVRGGRIGVDVERLDRSAAHDLGGLDRAFTPSERQWVAGAATTGESGRRALRLWTLKEAYAKARGLGLGLAFDSFAFSLADDTGVTAFRPPPDDPQGPWRFAELEPVPGLQAAVAVLPAPARGPALASGRAPAAPLALHLHLHDFPWGGRTGAGRALPLPAAPPLP